jgi:ribosomal protein S6--L-glutamate ligase
MSVLQGRLIELWVEAREGQPAVNPVMQALLRDLQEAGASTRVRVPEYEIVDPDRLMQGRRPDLVLLKSATTLSLSLATADEASGVRFLNSAEATVSAHDKAATVARLAAAGLPVPRTYLAATPNPTVEIPPDGDGGWVVKPVRGVHGQGVSIHSDCASALAMLAERDSPGGFVVDDGTRLVQRQVGQDSEADVKVYVAGETIYAGAKAFSEQSYTSNAIQEQTLDLFTTEMIFAVGETLGLRLFGVDLRFAEGPPRIIDANPFPGYRGFPSAVGALRHEIMRALEDQ